MKEQITEKLSKLFFPNRYRAIKAKEFLMDYEKKLNDALRKKESEIQMLKRKIRRMEREK